MYKVLIRVFGNYVDYESAGNYREAYDIATRASNEGWLHIQIVNPNGTINQF